MNRKEFIKSSSIILGGSLISTNFSLAENINTDIKFKKALGFEMIKEDLSILDKFKLVKDLGFDGVEINTPLNYPIDELRHASESTGILIPSTVNKDHWAKPLSSPKQDVRSAIVESINQSIEQTKILGGDTVLVVPGVVNSSISYQEAYKNSLETIHQLIPMAEKTGVKIGLENVWNNFILSPIEAKDFIEKINHPLVGWYFDIGNVLRYGWPEHWIETLNSNIFKLHVKEFSKSKMDNEGLRKGFNVELTKGDIDWTKVIKALHDINYKDEWLVLELPGGNREYLEQQSFNLDKIIKM